MHKRPAPAVRSRDRRRVTLVTSAWGDGDQERPYALRLIAGTLATRAQVTVVHVVPPMHVAVTGEGPAEVHDGAFTIRRVTGGVPEPATQAAVLAAVGGWQAGGQLPQIAGRGLLELEGGWSEAVLPEVEASAPDLVVLGGIQQAWPAPALAALASRPWRRVLVPLAGDDPKLSLAGYRDLLGVADVVATLTRAERRQVQAAGVGASIVELKVPVRVNPAARRQRLVGLTTFDGFVLVLRGFPPGATERPELPEYERLRALVPGVDFADVSESGWRVSRGDRLEIVRVGHARVNLWRLMAHALVTVDVRPGGLFGREVIESLWLGTPVMVPAGHPAAELVEESGGGIVLDESADLAEAVASLVAGGRRSALAEQGEAWAHEHHSDQWRFVQAVVSGLLD